MAQKIDTVELVAKADTRLDRGAEVCLAEHIGIEIFFGDHCRIARLASDQRPLAEEIAGAQTCNVVTFAVNHLAPFLLTNLLLGRLKATAPARIVTVASEAHRGHRLNPNQLARPLDWGFLRAYGRSKLCNILFTLELAARLADSDVVATCLHPGVVATAIGERGGLTELVWRLMKPFMTTPEKGAETPLFLATVPDPTPFHGGYVIGKSLARPDPGALDRNLARGLWDESARLVGL